MTAVRLAPAFPSAMLCALLAAAPSAFAQAPPAPVQAALTLRAPDRLDVTYTIPPSCPQLVFVNAGIHTAAAVQLRRDWQAADACTVVDSGKVAPARPGCTTLRVRVPATRLALDRIYPWALPLGDGLYAHTMAYAVAPSCGPVDWSFAAPHGTVIVDGVATAGLAQRPAADGSDALPVILLQSPPDGRRLHLSSGFTPAGKDFIQQTLATSEATLRAMLPDLPFAVPYVLATVTQDGETAGDVANQTVMRLSMQAAPQPEQRVPMTGFVAHEMAHLAQPVAGRWHDTWNADDNLLAEGGAEFLRWAAATRAGWATPAEQAQDLERAVTGCILAAAGGSWPATPNRGRGAAPYACGFTFYAIGLAGGGATSSPLLRMRDYYRTARSGGPTDFALALECGATPGCTPRWLNRFGSDEAVDSVLRDYAMAPGAILRAAPWTPAMLEMVRRRLIARLMQRDCHGLVHVAHRDGAAVVVPGMQCDVLRDGMAIVSAEGVSLFADVHGLHAAARACSGRGNTVLGLRDGGSVTLACDRSAYVPQQLYSAVIANAAQLAR